MRATAETRTKPAKPAAADEAASGKTREPAFGIVVAIIAAALVWPVLIGLYIYFFH